MVLWVVKLTATQRLAAVEAHGRVLSLQGAAASIAEVVGLAAAGAVVTALGVQPGAFALAAVPIVVGLVTGPALAARLRSVKLAGPEAQVSQE